MQSPMERFGRISYKFDGGITFFVIKAETGNCAYFGYAQDHQAIHRRTESSELCPAHHPVLCQMDREDHSLFAGTR